MVVRSYKTTSLCFLPTQQPGSLLHWVSYTLAGCKSTDLWAVAQWAMVLGCAMSLLAVGCTAALACQNMSRAQCHLYTVLCQPPNQWVLAQKVLVLFVLWLEATHRLAVRLPCPGAHQKPQVQGRWEPRIPASPHHECLLIL